MGQWGRKRLNKATEPKSCSKGVWSQDLSRQSLVRKRPLMLQPVTIWGWTREGAGSGGLVYKLASPLCGASLPWPRVPGSVLRAPVQTRGPRLLPAAARARLAGGHSRAQRLCCLRVSQVHTGPGLAWQPSNLFQSRLPSPHMLPPPPEPGARAYPMMHRASSVPSGPPCCWSER